MTADNTNSTQPTTNAAALSAVASGESRFFANAVASWYLNTIDPYSPHSQNIESRLRHPVHVVTRRILYGNVHDTQQADGNNDLEGLFNDDDGDIKEGPPSLTRRSAARMEAFLSGCSVALREPHQNEAPPTPPVRQMTNTPPTSAGSKSKNGTKVKKKNVLPSMPDMNGNKTKKMVQLQELGQSAVVRSHSRTNSLGAPKICPQIDRGDLLLRLEIYCRTLRRIRCLADANPDEPMQECVIQYEPKKAIRSRIGLIVRTYLRNVDCVRDVHKTLMTLILRATLEVLAVEAWCPELRSAVDRLATQYEHKVSFASLAFLSSPDNSAEAHLVPLLTKYFEYLQMDFKDLVSRCELERMLRTVLDSDLRHFFKTSIFHSVGHILDECRRERESLDNIALPPPWVEGVFGMAAGGEDIKGNVDAAIQQYVSDQDLVKQSLRDMRREVITVNGKVLPTAHSHMELAEHLGEILNSLSHMSPRKQLGRKKSSRRRQSLYTSDFGLELESDFSGSESEASLISKIDVGLVDVLARRLLISASRTGTGGDAYFIVRDLFGGEEVEVVPHHSPHGKMNQGTIEIIVNFNQVIIKCHNKFDIFPKPIVSDMDALIQFHTTTTEVIALQQTRDASHLTILKEKQTEMTGWRTLAIRPAYYERVHLH